MFQQYIDMVDGYKLITIAILVIIDLVLGIVVAIKSKEFQFSKLSNYLNSTVLGYVGGYFLVGGVALVHPDFSAMVTGAWVILDAAMLATIWGKLGKLGLPTPKIISQ
jgi:hypothetical protein